MQSTASVEEGVKPCLSSSSSSRRSRTKRTPNSGSGSQDFNRAYAKHPGLFCRILLQPREGGNYVAIVEHDSYETFIAMHISSTRQTSGRECKQSSKAILDPDVYHVETG